MSKTLNLIDILLTTGRHLFLMGRYTEALTPLTKLRGFRSLPDHVNEELQSLLAEIHLQHKKYKDARRHLAAAIAMSPLKADYFYLMGVAIEEDETADHKRAEMYYGRAVELEPTEPTYLIDFASYLFTIGKDKAALRHLRKAYSSRVSDAEVVARVADILRRQGHAPEATTKLRAALFHNHGAAAFRQIWQQHQFALAHDRQQKQAPGGRQSDNAPILLPFTANERHGKYLELGAKTIRIDQAETLNPPQKREPQPHRKPPKKG
jgi:tetratricopeptide (TPR) repeat protein